jgi:hypothetical protein
LLQGLGAFQRFQATMDQELIPACAVLIFLPRVFPKKLRNLYGLRYKKRGSLGLAEAQQCVSLLSSPSFDPEGWRGESGGRLSLGSGQCYVAS